MNDNKRARREIWSLERIKEGLNLFHKQHNRYPTATEFNEFKDLPSAKTIERKYGGLVELRKLLDLEGQADFRTGKHSTNRAYKINKRAHELEQKIYNILIEYFGVEFVHREYFLIDDRRIRIDFFVFHKKGTFSVDVFYPANIKNFYGCLNVKIKKYSDPIMRQSPVIFLQMNQELSQEEIDKAVGKKKYKLIEGQKVMCLDTFKNFISLFDSR